jgi:LuxR family transcriptional regulator, regulator of acetate metabolism
MTSERALTRRELECLSGLAVGKTNEELARELGVARSTVSTYVRRARKVLHAKTNTHAVVLAVLAGVIRMGGGEP